MIVINARFLCQHVSGVQRFAFEVSSRLKKLNKNVVFVCPNQIVRHDWAKELEPIIIGTKAGHTWEQIELAKYLLQNKNPLLLNLGNTGPVFYKNQITVMHDVAYLAYPENFSMSFRLWYSIMSHFICKNAKKIITVSNFSKSEIERYLKCPSDKIEVAYNGLSRLPEAKAHANQNNYFLIVGNLDPRKNITRAIKAFYLANIPKNIKLKIVGLHSKVFANVDIHNNEQVEYLGQQDDESLASLYKGAIALLYPSIYEGFGLPPLEAMSNGCPVIASDIKVLKEVLGDDALFADPFNESAISRHIENIYINENIRKELIKKGYDRSKLFNWDKTAEKINSLLN